MRDALERFRARTGAFAVGGGVARAEGTSITDVVGVRGSDDDTPVTVGDQWHLGSCTKSLTAALYARLVELGRARWGTPVGDLFPDLDGLDPGWSGRTVDELLLCRAGVSPNLPPATMAAARADTRPLVDQRSRAVRLALGAPPDEPGTFRYSNLGYIVVGAAIDRLAGTTYEDAFRDLLLRPLGVTSGGWGPPPAIRGHPPRLLLGTRAIGRRGAAPPGDPRSDNPEAYNPAGRFHVSLPDWCRLQRLFLDGAGVLGPASIERLLRVAPGNGGPTMAMGWAPAPLGDGELGMQGSNTAWSATALIARGRDRTSLVVASDGRTRTLTASAGLAAELLELTRP